MSVPRACAAVPGISVPLPAYLYSSSINSPDYYVVETSAGVVTKTTDRDSLRYTYNGTRRVRQLALGCESNYTRRV